MKYWPDKPTRPLVWGPVVWWLNVWISIKTEHVRVVLLCGDSSNRSYVNLGRRVSVRKVQWLIRPHCLRTCLCGSQGTYPWPQQQFVREESRQCGNFDVTQFNANGSTLALSQDLYTVASSIGWGYNIGCYNIVILRLLRPVFGPPARPPALLVFFTTSWIL